MEERINKPRVFLSHSKKNVDFIENLANDLRKCQIDPWLDTDQIRHGKSWQDSIFEYGLPTCDAVLVYFTEISIQSAVVKQEMDVGLLQNLKDNNIAFLPYVSEEKLRSQLRPDIQARQVLEWNEKNYHVLLPRVVAEIWRSYLERVVTAAIQSEHLKRVEAELELEKYRSQPDDVFSKSENREFEFILDAFNRLIPFEIRLHKRNKEEEIAVDYQCTLNLFSYVALLSDFYDAHGWWGIRFAATKEVQRLVGIENDTDFHPFRLADIPDITDNLLMHGLLERYSYTTVDEYRSERLNHKLELSKKYFRLRYWLAFHKKLPLHVEVEVKDFTETSLGSKINNEDVPF